MRERLIQVEFNADEMDYIATVMLYWRIVAREKMGIPLDDKDKALLQQSFDELCFYEARMIGNNLAQKLLRCNNAAMSTLTEKYV